MEAEAFLITSQANVRYLTGFSGSNGQLIATYYNPSPTAGEDFGNAVGALGEWCLAKLANVEPECHVDVEREVVFDRDSHDLVQPMLAFFLYFVHERG